MKKKLIASITSFALLFTTVFCGLSVPVNATEATDEGLPEITDVKYEFYRDPETGHIGMLEPTVYSMRSSGESSDEISPNGIIIPEKYPNVANPINYLYGKFPATRNQAPNNTRYGTCWAHAATATAEFDLVKNHGASGYNNSLNLSELQLAWFHYHTGTELDGLEGDSSVLAPNSVKHYLDIGGNINFSMHTLSQWKGYTDEKTLPYSLVTSNKNYNVSRNYASLHNWAQFRGSKLLNIKTASGRASVKEAILNQGAVYISYFADSRYYTKSSNFYYNDNNTTTNHDIVIVGWDDAKSAWLARNSWEVSSSGSGSNNTYFWLSYYDTSLAQTAYALDFEPGSTTDNLYQYDGSTTHSTLSTSSAANIFKANKNGSYIERLDSVMVSFTTVENVRYKVEIYTNPSSSNPKSGILQSAATTTGYTSAKGIYTIDLANPVYLNPGERFSIVVTILDSKGNPYVGKFEIESAINYTYDQGTPWFNTTAYADAGESFAYFNGFWKDVSEYDDIYGNVRIKAITSDTTLKKKYTINYQLNGGVNNSANPTYFFSDANGTFTLQNPTRNGYHFIGWYTDATFTNNNKVDKISYNDKKNITLYAKWCANNGPERAEVSKPATKSSDGYYTSYCQGCGKLKGTYPIYAISSVKLASDKVTYTGKTISPVPVIMDSRGHALVYNVDFTCTYNTSKRVNTGRYSVTVKFKDKYSADAVKLNFTVIPKAPATMSATLYGYDDIKVSWSKCTGASGYAVYYKKSTSSKYTLLKRTTARTLKKANLSDNVKYNFKVVPYYKYKLNGKYNYAGTNYKTASATTLKKLTQPKMKKEGSRVALTWQSISGASGYQVYWASKKNGKYKKLCDYSNKYVGMSFSVGKGQTYYYKTRAYKKVGKTKIYGPWSTAKAFKR